MIQGGRGAYRNLGAGRGARYTAPSAGRRNEGGKSAARGAGRRGARYAVRGDARRPPEVILARHCEKTNKLTFAGARFPFSLTLTSRLPSFSVAVLAFSAFPRFL